MGINPYIVFIKVINNTMLLTTEVFLMKVKEFKIKSPALDLDKSLPRRRRFVKF